MERHNGKVSPCDEDCVLDPFSLTCFLPDRTPIQRLEREKDCMFGVLRIIKLSHGQRESTAR